MKNLKLILLCILIQSCAVKSNIGDQNIFKIFKKEKFREYVFYHGQKDNDTVLFIAKSAELTSCKKKIKYISSEKLKTISKIESKTDTIVFVYLSRSVNGFNVMNCDCVPGDPKKIYLDSYWQYPYSFDCNSIR